MKSSTIHDDYNLVEAGLNPDDVRTLAIKARALAEMLAVCSDGMIKGNDHVIAHYALNCYADLIFSENKIEAEHDDFARGIIRDHANSLSAKMVSHCRAIPRQPESVHLTVFENTLMQRALRRWARLLMDELRSEERRAKAA